MTDGAGADPRAISLARPAPAAQVRLQYRFDESVSLGGPSGIHHVERWTVSVQRETGDEIGDATVLVFNLEPGADIGAFADPVSGTWIDVDTTAAVPPAMDEPDADTHVLLLERVWIHPDHRGQGLGPIVAAAVIERLGRGCHLAACYPAPFEHAPDGPLEHQRAVAALSAVWSKVGFRHWRDGVWMLDLRTVDIHAVRETLVAGRSRRGFG